MARSDRAAFLRQLIDTEAEMDALFQELAQDIGGLVLRAQDADGVIPIAVEFHLQIHGPDAGATSEPAV